MRDIFYLDQYKTDLDIAYLDSLEKSNEVRVFNQKKQYEYYIGDFDIVQRYLLTALKRTWKDYTVERMPKSYANIIKKVVNSLTAIYKQPPVRSIYIDGKKSDEYSKYLNSILDPSLNKYDKQTHRLGKLHNTAVPFLRFENGKFTQRVHSSWYYNVYSDYDNHLDMRKITYSQYFDFSGKVELYTVVWTDTEHYIISSDGVKMPYPGLDTMENIYGIIPVPYLRFSDENDFWGEGMSMATNENEQINVLLSKLNYDDIILGTAGILLGLNLGKLATTQEGNEDNTSQVTTIPGGRDAIVKVDQDRGDTRTADLKFVSTNPQIAEVINAIDWKIKLLAMEYGLNPNNFSVSSKAESGFSRLVGSFEQIEVREEDIDACREYEQRRFDILKKMNNVLANSSYEGADNLMEIPDNAEMFVDFMDVKPQLSGTELWSDRQEREVRNIGTPATWVMEDNPDIKTEKQAMEILTNNKEINDKFLQTTLPKDGRANKVAPTASGSTIGAGVAKI